MVWLRLLILTVGIERIPYLGAAEIKWVDDAVVQQAKQATVIIDLGLNNAMAAGFFATDDGLIVTGAPLLEGCREVTVKNSRGEQIKVSRVAAMDDTKQVAVLATGHRPPAFLKLRDQSAAVGNACVICSVTPGGGIAVADAVLLARIAPGVIPELRDCETWSLAMKPSLQIGSGGALISGDGLVAGMHLYSTMRAGSFLQPFVMAVTETAIASALALARKGGEGRAFPAQGEINPQNMNLGPHYVEGRRLRSLGKYEDAIVEFQKASREHPENALPLDAQATSLISLGRLQEARQITEATLRLAPDHPLYRGRLAGILAQQGEADDAVKHLRSLKENFPLFSDVSGKLAHMLMASGQTAEAETCAKKACELEPDSMAYWEQYWKILVTVGKVEESGRARDQLSELESTYFKLKYSAPKRE